MFEDKETETEVLVGELDRTRDVVNALQDENRELKVRLFMISVLPFFTTALQKSESFPLIKVSE